MTRLEPKEVKYSMLLLLKGLVDFEEADQEPDPMEISNLSWNESRKV
jgi:hypothetical protein